MLAIERKNQILTILQEDKRVLVSDLSNRFNVSEETIRRDLEKLEIDGYVVKTYGGAVIKEDTNVDLPYFIRKKKNVIGKQRIAELAAELICDGDSIMLDASSTAVFIAKKIKDKKNITLITNSIEILFELSDVTGWKILSTGGEMKDGSLSLVGSRAESAVKNYNADKAFISCKGFERNSGVSDTNEMIAIMKSAMLSCSKEKILAIDSSKFDLISLVKILPSNELDVIITDKKPDDNWLEYFEKYNIKCYYPQ
jgi:DeoR/GlpR family transcriptional regulator of sugar metabolism